MISMRASLPPTFACRMIKKISEENFDFMKVLKHFGEVGVDSP
jgi:hypothetical protein